MTPPDRMDEWLTGFKARHGLDVPLAAEPDLAAERAGRAAEYAAEHVPLLFADAVPTVPEVEAWVAEVIRRAVADSQARGQRVATVRRGPSVLLLGVTGVGKTFEAYGAVRVISLFGLHTPWVAVAAADLYARLRPRHGVDSEAEFAAVVDAPVLVLDDIGAARGTPLVEEVNLRLVNRRYEHGRPTLITSNLLPRDLKGALGDRVTSRLREMAHQVAIKGDDRRGRAS